ncbi:MULTISPECIES: folate-binding protein YgfZ [unclassified Ruegeria]|uniref:CAF17-like 4Fe-4S cluster assembly/insertion protein YgfZ n=1 Tax=unclassified Ruegeria TaxID=2625375 RepID=UPI00148837DE|nr:MULTISPECIES: folate-binding protein YgfZ [unclassified Ruegeria]NOD77454.1 folate-binding protein [Ruegeria sp. HKCCD4332]NOD87877.1 folate-binding protein [Ruegeria sp. HKCCD4318]NOE14247.1 folate-binding protein [Ruegeria sp. HKCCD4318-2]NOG08396.1 folate-binding protein YgfZ [Ruegeria sp. HKCCD4315]
MPTRRILRLTGSDTESFLQDLITNDIQGLDDGLVYAALLTPQGKYLADFFLKRDGDGVLLDAAEHLADDLIKRLNMYKLRADVAIESTDMNLQRGTGSSPESALPDPRHPDMGWRMYSAAPEQDDGTDFDALRVQHCIPEAGTELTQDSYILESGFEALNGVDFKKGCYVGQEVTARMKHKTELRKGLRRVVIDGTAPVGTEITANGKTAGTLFTQSGGHAIAYLRFDRAGGEMQAGEATVRLTD